MDTNAVLADVRNSRLRGIIEAELGDGEPVLAVMPGREAQAVALTNHRLIVAQGKMLMRGSQSVRLSDVVSISAGLTAMHIELTNSSSYDLPLWPNQGQAAKAFIKKVHDAQAPTPRPAQAAPSEQSVADELAKLVQLRAEGVLTQEEFQAQKTRVLS